MFQKYSAFNLGYQVWLFNLIIIIFIKIMSCNFILKIIISFIIYIEVSKGKFIIYIGIIGPVSCFDCINFKVSLVIKIIKFIGIKNMVPLVMFVIFHVNVITCQIFNLPHIYHIFVEKIIFWNENFLINHMVSKHGSNYMKWHGSILLQLSHKLQNI
jgi:hypothetical protein